MSQRVKPNPPGSSAVAARAVAAVFVPEDTCRCLCGFAAGQGLALGPRRTAASALGNPGSQQRLLGSPSGLVLLPWLSKYCLRAPLDQAAPCPISSSSHSSDRTADKDSSVSCSLSGGDQTQPAYWEVACHGSQSTGCSLLSHTLLAAEQIRGQGHALQRPGNYMRNVSSSSN